MRKALSINKAQYETELGLGVADLGAIDTGFLLCYTLGQFVAGYLGDLYGGRVLLSWALAGTAGCLVALSMSRSAEQLVLLNMVHGFPQATGYPACIKLLALWVVGPDKSYTMGLWGTCTAVGGFIGITAGTWLLDSYGWTATFLVPAPCMLGLAVFCWIHITDSPAADCLLLAKRDSDVEAAMQSEQLIVPKVSAVAAPGLYDAMQLPGVRRVGCAYFFLKFTR